VRATIDFRRAPMGGGLLPETITHVELGLRWQVLEVLEHWRHPEGMKAGGSAVIEAWRLRVSGPLPGRPGELGVFALTARNHADRPYWWIWPERTS
jgi:hypothetical protein